MLVRKCLDARPDAPIFPPGVSRTQSFVAREKSADLSTRKSRSVSLLPLCSSLHRRNEKRGRERTSASKVQVDFSACSSVPWRKVYVAEGRANKAESLRPSLSTSKTSASTEVIRKREEDERNLPLEPRDDPSRIRDVIYRHCLPKSEGRAGAYAIRKLSEIYLLGFVRATAFAKTRFVTLRLSV